jgi:hypothetical protein
MADISHEADVICIPFCKLFTQLPESRQWSLVFVSIESDFTKPFVRSQTKDS